MEESEVMRRQRELRGSLQAFLEIRQVRRLLSGKGKIDPWVLRIAGEINGLQVRCFVSTAGLSVRLVPSFVSSRAALASD